MGRDQTSEECAHAAHPCVPGGTACKGSPLGGWGASLGLEPCCLQGAGQEWFPGSVSGGGVVEDETLATLLAQCWPEQKCCLPHRPSFLLAFLPSSFFLLPFFKCRLNLEAAGDPLKALSREGMMLFALEEGSPGEHWDWTGAWRSAPGKPVIRPMSRESRKLGQGHTTGKQRGRQFASSCLDTHSC